ncbi:MAG: flagellar hook-associated protein FlgK [Verrucomicrobiota bacterium]
MLGLFGTLNLGARSMSTQRAGVEVAGQNLANVNNPAYARQRVNIATSITISSEIGPMGTGAEAVAIQQMRNALLDGQIQAEASNRGSLTSQQIALQYTQAALGTQIDRMATGAEGATAAQGVGGGHSLADSMSALFNAFQSLSTNPTSMAERQTLLMKAASLALQFNQLDTRLNNLTNSLNATIDSEVNAANQLLGDIANLNKLITTAEVTSGGTANDLRDTRQARIEELAKYVKLDITNGTGSALNISIGGVDMVTDNQVADTLQSYDAGGGQMMLRATTAGTPLTVTSGSIQGTIIARDGAVADLQTNVNALATALITEVNAIHASGFSLSGSTGANFFTGTDATNMGVNGALINDPTLLQAAGVSGASGDNQTALALAQLAQTKHAAFNNQTFNQAYGQNVAAFGQELSTINSQLGDQEAIEDMLLRQRDSLGGVSLDEEMTDLTRFQKAFAASARLITTVDEMLETLINMKR